MEADRRPFQSINIGANSTEPGRDRFTTDGIFQPLRSASWRCNLSALSQRYDLYFMASGDGVVVYEPNFPFQTLGARPALYIPPSLAAPTAQGYLASHSNRPDLHAHEINHLMVGDLGSEEILLLSTDSGNVAAYHTKAIYEAIRRDPYRHNPAGSSDFVGLRAFFLHWVQESAWGLAIHKTSRMIAVSANVPYLAESRDAKAKITVFAFALTNYSDTSADDSDENTSVSKLVYGTEWHNWTARKSQEIPPRDRNYKIVLAGEDGHVTNIPSVSFVNTREDASGSWLLSCDIYGDTKCWQIWTGTCYGTWDFAESPTRFSRLHQRRADGGWVVAALDPLSFRPTNSMEAFCGHSKAPQYHGHLGTGDSYNITSVVRLRTPGRSQRHPLHEEDSEEDADEAPDHYQAESSWLDDDSDTLSVIQGIRPDDTSRTPVPHADRTVDLPERPSRHADAAQEPVTEQSPPILNDVQRPRTSSDDTTNSVHNLAGQISHPTANEVAEDMDANLSVSSLAAQELSTDHDVDSSSADDNQSSPTTSDQTQRTSIDIELGPPLLPSSPDASSNDAAQPARKSTTPTKRLRGSRAISFQKPVKIPFIPTLHLSHSHLRLINLPRSRSPHLFCANILKQDLPEALVGAHDHSLLRLNMLQQIPELGIVVIGSQLGRVAVCSLTKFTPTGAFGLRVDWTLPTRRQEQANVRPATACLLGIATGPIQGRQFPWPDPHHDEDDEDWANNRTVDGVETTFDDNVVSLAAACHTYTTSSSSSDDDTSWSLRQKNRQTQRGKQATPKRKKGRNSTSNKASSAGSPVAKERRKWPKRPRQEEDWEVMEGTRRYRLMLTYSDMTVLSYELGRSVERDEVCLDVG